MTKKSIFSKLKTVFYMKISNIQMFRNFNKWCFGALALIAFSTSAIAQDVKPDGATLFKKCATCHQPHKDGTGPKLAGVRAKWESGGAKEGSLYTWVKNWEAAAAIDPYAKGVSTWSATAMNKFPELTDDDVTAILDWIDAQPDPANAAPVAGGVGVDGYAATDEDEGSTSWIWLLLAIVSIAIVLSVSGVRRHLKMIAAEQDGTSYINGATYGEEFKAWAWKYRLWVGLGSLVLVLSVVVVLLLSLYTIDIKENYQPSQPIDFPHSVHAGINGIDCKYCHNSASESKSAGYPTVNVCMNCHKQINGQTPEQQAKIQSIYDAAGWDGKEYTGKTKPIVWNKVHVLPDHVYFNHKQHVVVGGVDCKQCHGDMTKMEELAKVVPVAELNMIEGNVKLTRPTLTMGWCIECHGEKEISTGSIDSKGNGYYDEIHKRLLDNDKSLYKDYLDDGKVTVKELGGWECSKCHY
jgi:cytochrome c553